MPVSNVPTEPSIPQLKSALTRFKRYLEEINSFSPSLLGRDDPAPTGWRNKVNATLAELWPIQSQNNSTFYIHGFTRLVKSISQKELETYWNTDLKKARIQLETLIAYISERIESAEASEVVEETVGSFSSNIFLPKTSDYLKKFFSSKYMSYREDSIELRSDKGYGRYYKNSEVEQSLRDILGNIMDTFSDLRIPESFPSPESMILAVENFQTLVKRNLKDHLEDAIEHYRSQGKEDEIPEPIWQIARIHAEVISALDHVLKDGEVLAYNQSAQQLLTSQQSALTLLRATLHGFHRVAQQLKVRRKDGGTARPTLTIADEYDVQDLLHGLLKIHFEDIRSEEWTPSYLGGSNRMDFLLKQEQIVVEVKMTRTGLKNKVLGEELSVDYVHYRSHADCRHLVCFVYDPAGFVTNPKGFCSDFAKLGANDPSLSSEVIIIPSI